MTTRISILLLGLGLAVTGILAPGCSEDDTTTPPTPTRPSFGNTVLPQAVAGQPYSQTLTPTGGTRPYTWSYDEQDLPPGIGVTTSESEITFAGTPTTPGDYTVPVTVTDVATASDDTDVTIRVTGALDISGSWILDFEITRALGVCLGEAGTAAAIPVTLTQTAGTGAGNFDVTLTGTLGDASTQITGTITDWNQLALAGSFADDGGTTTSTLDLEVISNSSLRGTETWSWVGPDGECPNGLSDILGRRP